MGINSTEVAYGFGQMGSGFADGTASLTPPSGKKIVAIQFLSDSTLGRLNQSNSAGDAYFGHIAQDSDLQPGSVATDGGNTFPAGITVFGRWSEVKLLTGSAIVYYGH